LKLKPLLLRRRKHREARSLSSRLDAELAAADAVAVAIGAKPALPLRRRLCRPHRSWRSLLA
jgi:hypothetical protein